ncbi:MAG: SLC13 family permease [Porticoccaceae bacterium]|nr:SLC13 family permease [Porticoccaceae bacterium]
MNLPTAAEQLIVFACMGVIIVGLSATRLKPTLIFGGVISFLYLIDMISLDDALGHFTNSALVTLILLVLLMLAIEKTRLFRRFGKKLFSGNYIFTLFKLGLASGLMSSVANNTAVVASFMSAVKNQTRFVPSRLLIPLSYASIWGGTLTLVGTSTNLVLNGLVLDNGMDSLRMFDFALIGLPIFVICLGVLLLIAPYSLPKQEIANDDTKTYFLEARIQADSPLIGNSLLDNGFRNLADLFLVEIIRDGYLIRPVSPEEIIEANDILGFSGDIENVQALNQFKGLTVFEDDQASLSDNLVDVVISHNATITGKPIKAINFRALFDAAVVAVRRGNQRLGGGLGKIVLQPGDNLVLATGHDFKNRHNLQRNFIILGDIETRDHLPTFAEYACIIGFIGIVALAAAGILTLFKGLALMFCLLVGTGLLGVNELRRNFPFELIIVIGAALGFAQVMQSSGAAQLIADGIISGLTGSGVYGALIASFILTLLLTELITNNAAAVLVFPIALSLAQQYQADPMPFIMAVAFGASASFLSPYGYQTNLMVYSVGNYRITDYLKTGLPISLTYTAVALTMIPLIYPFYP